MFTRLPEPDNIGEIPQAPSSANVLLSGVQQLPAQVDLALKQIPIFTPAQRQESYDNLAIINETLNDPRNSALTNVGATVANLGTLVTAMKFGSGPVTNAAIYGLGKIAGPTARLLGVTGLDMTATLGRMTTGGGFFSSDYLLQTPIKDLAKSELKYLLPSLPLKQGVASTLENYLDFKLVEFPAHIAKNYDSQNDTLKLQDAITEDLTDVYSFGLAAAPFVAGYLGYKAFSRINAIDNMQKFRTQHVNTLTPEKMKLLEEAVDDGSITNRQFDWYKRYVENPFDEAVQRDAVKIALEGGFKADPHANKILMQLMDEGDIKQYNKGYETLLTDNFNTTFIDYLANGSLDKLIADLSQNNEMHAGVIGVLDHMKKLLVDRDIKIGRLDEMLEDIRARMGDKEFMSHEDIYNHLKSQGYKIENVPYEIPLDVKNKLKLAKRLAEMEKSGSFQYKSLRGDEAKQQILADIDNIKLKTPKEEVKTLYDQLSNKIEVGKNISLDKDYYRLRELAEVWPEADVALRNLALKDTYNRAESHYDLLNSMVEVSQKNLATSADPFKLEQYLANYVDRTAGNYKNYAEPESLMAETDRQIQNLRSTLDNPRDEAELLSVDRDVLDNVIQADGKLIIDEFDNAKSKFDQFKENQNTFNSLIDCVKGKL